MATTSGIAQYYSSAFKALPQKALPLGTPSSVYEPIQQGTVEAGQAFVQYFQAVIPVGFGWASATNYDYLNLVSIGGNFPNATGNTVVPGFRLDYFTISCSGNAGGTLLTLIGFGTGNTLTTNAAGSSYLGGGSITGTPIVAATGVTLQSANIAEASGATVGGTSTGYTALQSINPAVLTAADTLVLVPKATANQTTTLQTVSGWVRYYLTSPTGY